MKKIIPLFFPLFISISLFSQNKLAYRLFDIKGKKVSYKALKKQVLKADIILFGEFHDNPISHWLELEIIKDLNKSENLIIGAEMFESDNQQLINDYLSGVLNFNTLDSMGRLWSNYKTDYSPIVEYAKKNNLPVVATNIPRKYASKVFKNGGFQALDNLSDFEKKFIAPLPIDFDIELSQYKNMLDMMVIMRHLTLLRLRQLKMQQWLILFYKIILRAINSYILMAPIIQISVKVYSGI